MRKNVSGQTVGATIITAADGSAFTGSVTVHVTGDGGTQATGSVGSGACTSEGNSYFSYAPSQAETNYDHVAFTFTGTGAIPVTVQIYTTFPQTGDSFARLGAPAGASVSADIATRASQTSVDGVPTTAELEARTLAAASYATAANQTTIASAIAALNDLSAAEVNAEVDTAISDAALATAAALATVDQNVDDLKSGIIYGAAATGTLSTTQATTDLTGYADDQLIGRVIIWLSGDCEGEATSITDYAATGGLLTFDALTTSPANGDLFKVV